MANKRLSGIVPGLDEDQPKGGRSPRSHVFNNIFSSEPDEQPQPSSPRNKSNIQPEPVHTISKKDNDVLKSANNNVENKTLAKSVVPSNENVKLADKLLVKNGRIVNSDHSFNGDVYIEDGIIRAIGPDLQCPSNIPTVHANGKYILPGGVDLATYFHSGLEGVQTWGDFTVGTKAALVGGTTTIVDVIVCPKGSSPLELFNARQRAMSSQACCDFAFHIALSEFNPSMAREVEILVKEKGVISVQVYMGYRSLAMLDDDSLYDLLRLCRQVGAVFMVQPDNGCLVAKKDAELLQRGICGPEGHLMARTEESEAEATYRILLLADLASCPIMISPLGGQQAVNSLATARRQGKLAFGGVQLASLVLDKSALRSTNWSQAAGHVVTPPLRDLECRRALIGHLAGGDLVSVSSGHRAYKTDQRALGKGDFRRIPEGVIGVQERLAVLWQQTVVPGILDPCKFVSVTSSGPAKLLNMYPRKGHIGVGSDADIVIWNGELSHPYRPNTDYLPGLDTNIYSDVPCSSGPQVVITRGRIVLNTSASGGRLELNVEPGSGQFLHLEPFPQFLYTRVFAREKQASIPPAVSREPYTGPITDPNKEPDYVRGVSRLSIDAPSVDRPLSRRSEPRSASPPRPISTSEVVMRTKSGVRNQQSSSFSLGGDQIDDDRPVRSSIRTKHPPGGSSTNPFW